VLAERLVRLVLKRPGVAVAVAAGQGAAMAQLRDRRFDVVVVDVDLPRWPHLDSLGSLRAASPASLLVALTSDPEPETIAACREAGADVILSLSTDLPGLADLIACRSPS